MEEIKNLAKVDIPSLDRGYADAVAASNQQILGGLSELDNNIIKLDREVKNRTGVGTLLKIIVVVSGAVIATGFLTGWNWLIQVIGGVITLITAVERIFGNVDILLTKVAGRDAYSRIRREIVNKHEAKIIDVIKIRDIKPEEAAEMLIKVQSEIRDQIFQIDNEIKNSIANKNYQLLGRLALDEKKE